MNIAVLGGGNGGLAMAAYLCFNGHNVSLWNRTRDNIDMIIRNKYIYCEGEINGTFELDRVSDEIEEIVRGVSILLLTTPANSHCEIINKIIPYLHKGHVIILTPGRTFGSLVIKEILQNKNMNNIVLETQSIIFTCRKLTQNKVNILKLKQNIEISGVNMSELDAGLLGLPICLTSRLKRSNTISTSLGNVGMILHVAPVLMNIGWIEYSEVNFKYYYNGITQSIAKFIEKIDKERIAVAEKLGFELESTASWLQRVYGGEGTDLYSTIKNVNEYKSIDAPSSLKHRYIFEDITTGLAPLEFLGKQLGLNMVNTSLTIDLACQILEYDFRKNSRIISYKIIKKALGDI